MSPLPGWARQVRAAALCALAFGLASFEARAQAISFGKSVLQGTSLTNPTSLQFGPDGRLYVTQQNGTILIYNVTRNGPNSYVVSATQTITSVRDIPNRNDTTGAINASVTGREVTGVLVVGTAANPVIYVASSDPRIGAGGAGTDTNLDTNSGILSRLTWNGTTWVKLDLVRGLPRSEENHASNGLVLINSGNTLLIAQGGHTNMGAPSNNFALLPEYALSAAILSVNLVAIGNTTYDLPTLDDPAASRNTGTPGVDTNDPFGGNDGANQAKLVAGGPVQVYSPGYRNPYDLVVTRAGRLYTIDNGPNSGWGDVPQNEGGTNCTNATREPGVTHSDNLHFVTGPGFYGGHPNPTRANTANTFNGQSPVPASNSVECDYRNPGTQDGALATFGFSTNGLAEYTAANFAGAMDGNLIAASFDNVVYRIVLSANGQVATSVTPLFSSVGSTPLDVWAQPTAGPFPGSIWVADYSNNSVVVYEPADFVSCTGADNPGLDEDGDGFNNADEIDNGTNPCSAGDVPPDWDGDHLSNLNDPDDDNDGLPDGSDKFALDPQNGATTNLPLLLTWDNDAPAAGGLLDLGFTGLMTNGTSNYANLFNAGAMTAGGAAGVVTVDAVPEGDASGALNTQQYGFQVGVHVTAATPLFTVHTRILAPFAGVTPANFQSMGLFLGTGDQDHYVKIVVGADGGTGVTFGQEDGGPLLTRPASPVTLPGPDWIDLYLTIDAAAHTVTPIFIVTTNNVAGPVESLGGPATIPASWLAGPPGLAVGILSTSRGPAAPFPATWDFLKVRPGPAVECSSDPDCLDANPCTTDVCQSYTCLHLNNTNPCDDGLSCTSGDVCAAGSCTGTDACPSGQMCNPPTNSCILLNVDLDNDGLVGTADPCPTAPRNLCFGPVAVETAQGRTIRINAGTSAHECTGQKTDCTGRVWNDDYGYNLFLAGDACDLGGGGEGCVISGITTIFGCEDESTEDLFQCEHYDGIEAAPDLQYSFAVPNGPYLVNLYFASTYSGTTAVGSRVFNVLVEGAVAYANFDAVAAAGGSAIAVVRSKVVNVADGTLNISFGHVVENPSLKAIEVLRQDRDSDGFFPPNDCDDLNPAAHPGGVDNTCNGVDENCSGVADEGYAPVATQCGVGPCARAGVTSCVGGTVQNSCAPGEPSTEVCDGADNDCDTQIDEGYVPLPTSCGVGSCARTGETSCTGGSVHDSCVPGAPSAEVCDGADNDCNAVIDDAPPLQAIASLSVVAGAGPSDAALSWESIPGASAYDVVRGDVRTLVEGNGSFATAIDQCLVNDTASLGLVEGGTPAVGEGFFYVVRGVNCGGGSWDEGGAGQAVPRGPSFALSAAACP